MSSQYRITNAHLGAPGTSKAFWERSFYDQHYEGQPYPYSVQQDIAILRTVYRLQAHIAPRGFFFKAFQVVHRHLEDEGVFMMHGQSLPPSPLSVIRRFRRLLKVDDPRNIQTHKWDQMDNRCVEEMSRLLRICNEDMERSPKRGSNNSESGCQPNPQISDNDADPSPSSETFVVVGDRPSVHNSTRIILARDRTSPLGGPSNISDSDSLHNQLSEVHSSLDRNSCAVNEESDNDQEFLHVPKRQRIPQPLNVKATRNTSPGINVTSSTWARNDEKDNVLDINASKLDNSCSCKFQSSLESKLKLKRRHVEMEKDRFQSELQEIRMENCRLRRQINLQSQKRKQEILRDEMTCLRNACANISSLYSEV